MSITFSRWLLEELTPNQKRIVDSWPETRNPINISKHVIPSGQDRITIPLEDPHDHKVMPHPDIASHLEKHGYSVEDYSSGTAKDKYGRITKIGKALSSTKADPKLLNTFNSDPARQGGGKVHDNLQVVISRHPHDVAGMSTGRGWTSCMDMKDGVNKDYLKHEIAEGTHVAYLTQKGDHEVKNPIARIALKPFREEKSDRIILHPEHKTYGTAASSFEHTVNNFVNNHFPLKENTFYTKNSKVYDDSHNSGQVVALTSTITPDKIAHLSKPSNNIQELQSKQKKAMHIAMFGDDEQRDHLLNHPSHLVRGAVAVHGNDTHREILNNDPSEHVRTMSQTMTETKKRLENKS